MNIKQMNLRALKAEFELYYADLKTAQKLEGGTVNKRTEWELFRKEHEAMAGEVDEDRLGFGIRD